MTEQLVSGGVFINFVNELSRPIQVPPIVHAVTQHCIGVCCNVMGIDARSGGKSIVIAKHGVGGIRILNDLQVKACQLAAESLD